MEVTTTIDLLHTERSSTIKIHSILHHVQKEDLQPLHIENITTTTTTAPPHTHILNLPRELRDIILTFIVDSSPPPLDPKKSALPSLLRVNRQLRDEFAKIFYSRKLILAGGAPSPRYEKKFFDGFDPKHKEYVRRVHWLYDSYGTEDQARGRARELDIVSGVREGVWTVGFIDPFTRPFDGDRRARYVNAFGSYKRPGEV